MYQNVQRNQYVFSEDMISEDELFSRNCENNVARDKTRGSFRSFASPVHALAARRVEKRKRIRGGMESEKQNKRINLLRPVLTA